ncbi:Fe-S cluster assembly protein HesB [Actinocorallia longicatena]|uniref:Iron-sulfur cluster biosynthesis family protein n=1 Tax=Actinocorallia longicatena TaxID=111803 RepID=A0ABP6PVP9_9ACTN
MLTLTDTAVTVIRNLTAQPEVADTGGLRIAPTPDTPATLAVGFTPEPLAGDQVIEEDGARVFLDPEAANALDDKVLDAEVDGNGDIAFMLGLQPEH